MKMSRQCSDADFTMCQTVLRYHLAKKFDSRMKEGIRWAFYNISILMYFCELVKGLSGFSKDLFELFEKNRSCVCGCAEKVLIII